MGDQEELPGMERRDLPEIEQAADRYRKIRDERCAMSKRESEAKSTLIQVMMNAGRSLYSYNGLTVELSNVENVKVKSNKDDDYDEPATKRRQQRQQSPPTDVKIEEQSETEPQAVVCKCSHSASDHEENGACRWDECDCDGFTPMSEQVNDEDRERLHREAVASWRGETEIIEAEEKSPEAIYTCQGCGADCAPFDLRVTDGLCSRCWTPDADAADDWETRELKAPIEYADSFPAPRCDECGRIDGAHADTCGKRPWALTFEDYLAYAKEAKLKNPNSQARKWMLGREKDAEIIAWKQAQVPREMTERELAEAQANWQKMKAERKKKAVKRGSKAIRGRGRK